MGVRMGVFGFVTSGMRVQLGKGLRHHGGIQMAAFAGVDLNGGGAGGTDAVGIKTGLLVAFNHRHHPRIAHRETLAGTACGIQLTAGSTSVVLPEPGLDTRL